MSLKAQTKIPLKIKRMGINGEGIGFFPENPCFCSRSPQRVKISSAKLQVSRKILMEAKLLSVNKASKYRVTPMCDIYETCGGCQIMHLKYDKQLEFKTDLVQQALKSSHLKALNQYDIRSTSECRSLFTIGPKLQFQTRKFKRPGQVAGLYGSKFTLFGRIKRLFGSRSGYSSDLPMILVDLLTYSSDSNC